MRRLSGQYSVSDAPLEIRLFGALELLHGGRNASGFPTRKARSIFALLVLGRRKAHLRDQLAECFWPETKPSRSRASLRTELWRIRRTLASNGLDPSQYLQESREAVRFNPAVPCIVDTEEFDRAVDVWTAVQPGAANADTLGAALDLYRADLLEADYGEWCIYYREYYRAKFVGALELLMEHAMRSGEWRHAVELGNRLLMWEPLAEHIHRHLMSCHNAMGNRPAALQQYKRCATLLIQELAVEPMEETRALFDETRVQGEEAALVAAAAPNEAALRRARDALIEAVRRLDSAIVECGPLKSSADPTARPRP